MMNNNVPKVVRDGQVAVIYSPSYGAGWSTWAPDELAPRLVFAPEVVKWIEDGKTGDIEDLIKSMNLGVEYVAAVGLHDAIIKWVPVGTAFQIGEYDGSESFEPYHVENFFCA